MTAATIILVLVIFTALAFDFTNGFHDTGNAMATSIATNALKPKVAVLLAGLVVFGRDGKMLTYTALVLAQGSLAWWVRGR